MFNHWGCTSNYRPLSYPFIPVPTTMLKTKGLFISCEEASLTKSWQYFESIEHWILNSTLDKYLQQKHNFLIKFQSTLPTILCRVEGRDLKG